MFDNLLLSNLQTLPKMYQAIEKFAAQKNIKFESAVIELLSIGLEQVYPNYTNDLSVDNKIIDDDKSISMDQIINQLIGNIKVDADEINLEMVKNLTLEILNQQVDKLNIDQNDIDENKHESDVIASKYLQINNFFTEQEYHELINYCFSRQQEFIPTSTSTNLDSYRQSTVLYYFPEVQKLITEKIQLILPEILNQLEIPIFIPTEIESQITAHNDGHFYKVHNDNGSPDTAKRVLTYVYYFYQEPKAFSGGELKIYDSRIENNYYVATDSFQIIEPINNSIIFFPSHYLHEVLPIKCLSQKFEDSRFTVNGWIRN